MYLEENLTFLLLNSTLYIMYNTFITIHFYTFVHIKVHNWQKKQITVTKIYYIVCFPTNKKKQRYSDIFKV